MHSSIRFIHRIGPFNKIFGCILEDDFNGTWHRKGCQPHYKKVENSKWRWAVKIRIYKPFSDQFINKLAFNC